MEPKNTISELKILCNGQKRRLHFIKENISEHEDRAIQNIEKKKKKKLSRETENDDQ